jgi:hypothetical protein
MKKIIIALIAVLTTTTAFNQTSIYDALKLKARNEFQLGNLTVTQISTDGTFLANTDAYLVTQKAIKTYVDALTSSGYVPTSRTITIDGVTYNLAANRTFNIIPTQTGNSGKFLTTNGTSTSWATIDLSAYPTGSGTANRVAYWNGTNTLTSSSNLTFNGSAWSLTGTATISGNLTAKGTTIAFGDAASSADYIQTLNVFGRGTGFTSNNEIARINLSSSNDVSNAKGAVVSYRDGGNTSVGLRLHTMNAGSAVTALTLANDGEASFAKNLNISNGYSTKYGYTYPMWLGANATADGFYIYDPTASTYRFILNRNGRVMINSTSDHGEQLQVTGSTYLNGAVTATGTVNISSTSKYQSQGLNVLWHNGSNVSLDPTGYGVITGFWLSAGNYIHTPVGYRGNNYIASPATGISTAGAEVTSYSFGRADNSNSNNVTPLAGVWNYNHPTSGSTGGMGLLWKTSFGADVTGGAYLTEKMRLTPEGQLGIGITSVTANLHLKAGTATAGTAPLKFTAGTNLTTPENGAVEYDGTNYYATAGGVRYQLAKVLSTTTTWDVPSTSAGSINYTDVTVTGAASGDAVILGLPTTIPIGGARFFAVVISANTVRIYFENYSAGTLDPASASYTVSINK